MLRLLPRTWHRVCKHDSVRVVWSNVMRVSPYRLLSVVWRLLDGLAGMIEAFTVSLYHWRWLSLIHLVS